MLYGIPIPFGQSSFIPAVTRPHTNSSVVTATTYTIVNKYRPSIILASGSIIRLKVEAAPTGAATLSATYIGRSATSGDAWDFAATGTQVTWNGGVASLTMEAGQSYLSDEITFDLTDTESVSVAMNVASGSYLRFCSGIAPFVAYTKASVSEAATTNKGATYIARAGTNYFVSELQVA